MSNGVIGQMAAVRAMTVALTGNHSIMLWGPRNVGKHTLVEEFPPDVMARVFDSCPCGHFGSIIRDCTCSQVQLRRWANRFRREAVGTDMCVECPEVPGKYMTAGDKTERWRWDDHASNRVLRAQTALLHMPEAMRLDATAERTVEMFTRRMSPTVGQMQAVRRVARTVAALDCCADVLQAKHVAEAMQYQTLRAYAVLEIRSA